VCRDCVASDAPRIVCRSCAARGPIGGFEYRSALTIAGWPLIHVCAGLDPATMRPRVARGVIAIGSISVGILAIGGLAVGLFTLGGVSFGLVAAVGGLAAGAGLSIGGLAIGSVALGGAAVGFRYAVGGGAFAPHVIDGRQCDPAVLEFLRQWFSSRMIPPSC
jgi:hypothetical protein